jgi:hypothetical protein
MRYKVAPPARSLDFLADARGAVPLVPDSEADCCRAIQRATDVPDRETARAYLTFLQALTLVAESERGYHRTRTELAPETLATPFRERVFLVTELLDALERESRTPEAAFSAVRDAIPQWERGRNPNWAADWRAKVEHLLSWAVLFECCTVEAGRFERRPQ